MHRTIQSSDKNFLLLHKRVNKNTLVMLKRLPIGCNFVVQVETSSMESTIMAGQKVHAQRIAGKDVVVGDIIMYINKYYEKPVIHRIVTVKETHASRLYETKGDNAFKKDAHFVREGDVVAKIFLESKKRSFLYSLFRR